MATRRSTFQRVVGRVSGVVAGESRLKSAEKALQVMKDAGFSQRDINKAQRMIDDARARGVD
jgi:ABC-type sugar transport system substrate-binding protein